jgi:hypothetical protein
MHVEFLQTTTFTVGVMATPVSLGHDLLKTN